MQIVNTCILSMYLGTFLEIENNEHPFLHVVNTVDTHSL